jgi:hypothetical protein
MHNAKCRNSSLTYRRFKMTLVCFETSETRYQLERRYLTGTKSPSHFVIILSSYLKCNTFFKCHVDVAQLVEALRHNEGGPEFDSRTYESKNPLHVK